MRLHRAFLFCGFLLGPALNALGQFTTVINAPPSTVGSMIGPNTQLNLGEGGTTPLHFEAGRLFGANANIEVNVTGGIVQRYASFMRNVRANISGGAIGLGLTAHYNSQITFSGGDFRIDGVPVGGLDNEGQTVAIDLFGASVLTGTLVDGTPIALSNRTGEITNGVLRLERAAIAPLGPATLTASTDALGHGVRGGQTLTVDAGGTAPDYYQAGPGSVINVLTDGNVGGDLRLADATLNVNGGFVGSYASALKASVINLSQGEIGPFLNIGHGSAVNMTGGKIGYMPLVQGGALNISGGTIDDFFRVYQGRVQMSGDTVVDGITLDQDSELIMSGGLLYGLNAQSSRVTMTGGIAMSAAIGAGSQMEYWGGEIYQGLLASAGSQVTIVGGDFRINGTPVAAATNVGDVAAVDVPEGAVISGTLASGIPFLFSSSDYINRQWSGPDAFANGTLRLRVSALPVIGPANLVASTAGPLTGLRNSQTLLVDGPNFIGDHFHAGEGSTVNIPSGGTVGADFEAAGATINVTGGSISYLFDIASRTTVTLSAGSIGGSVDVMNQGLVKVTGGAIGNAAWVHDGGKIEMFAGAIGNDVRIYKGGLVKMTGGSIGEGLTIVKDGVAEIAGGSVGKHFTVGGAANVSGGVLADVYVSQGGVLNFDGGRSTGSVVVDSQGKLNLSGGVIEAYINAKPGSTVAMTGGDMTREFIAEGSQVKISGGNLGNSFRASLGSSVELSGGAQGPSFAPGENFTIFGADFELDGIPIAGLQTSGDQLRLVIPASGAALTGTLADGTPFAFRRDYRLGYPVTLRQVALPPVGPAQLTASRDAIPLGIRSGQTLTVDAGAVIARNFNAGKGSIVIVLPGGEVGPNFEATGATVNIAGGVVENGFGALHGSVVNVSGGIVGTNGFFGSGFYAYPGSQVNISGGTIKDLYAYEGTQLRISGGDLEKGMVIRPRVDARVSGGRFHDQLAVNSGASATLSGGEFDASLRLSPGGLLELFVTEAQLGGAVLNLPLGLQTTITARDLALAGRFAEGQAFDFLLTSAHVFGTDYFSADAVLTLTRVFNPGDYDGSGLVDDADHAVWLAALTTGNLAADGNYDRQVTDADLQVWQSRYGTDYSLVPECESLYLAALGIGVMLLSRRLTSARHAFSLGTAGPFAEHSLFQLAAPRRSRGYRPILRC